MANSQGLLFSEPSIAETGIWCTLGQGIDPAEWASLCRFIGKLSPREFGRLRKAVMGRKEGVFGLGHDSWAKVPIVSSWNELSEDSTSLNCPICDNIKGKNEFALFYLIMFLFVRKFDYNI